MNKDHTHALLPNKTVPHKKISQTESKVNLQPFINFQQCITKNAQTYSTVTCFNIFLHITVSHIILKINPLHVIFTYEEEETWKTIFT